MSKLRRSSRLLAILIIVSVFFTACEVPDISKFTEQSSEMTRGIRKGVKDTEGLLKAATERDDLYSDKTIEEIQKSLKEYQQAVKPTVAALDALDSYLEALNALAQANKKSGENSRAVVTSVGNLVSAVTGIAIADTTLNIATGLVTLVEDFRTAKDFKKRVTLAAEIVEGVRPVKDEKGKTVFVRHCTADADEQIIPASKELRRLAEIGVKKLNDAQKKKLKEIPPAEKWNYLHDQGAFDAGQWESVTASLAVIDKFHCGVIDFIKFNVEDLKVINQAVSQNMYRNAREKNRVVLGFYESIMANDRNVQNERERILNFKALIPIINQYMHNRAETRALATKRVLKNTLDSLFNLDSEVKTSVMDAIRNCADCGEMRNVLEADMSSADCDQACRTARTDALNQMFQRITRQQFDRSIGLIETIFDRKDSVLSAQNARYQEELKRIKPSYDAVNTELNAMKAKQNQLDSLLDSSLTALDAWAETHANLRVAVNTKKPLTASKLASKVREIWDIIKAETD